MQANSVAVHVCFLYPAGCPLTFFTVPRMPETVRMEAPSNFATSRPLLNMPRTNAVCLAILNGVPTSFSFFMTASDASRFSTTCQAKRLI